MYCYRCAAANSEVSYRSPEADTLFKSHNDSDHVTGPDEYIEAGELKSGDLFWTNYRNQPMYLRAIGVSNSVREPDKIRVVDSAHRSYTILKAKLIQIRRVSDELKEKK